MVRIAATLLVLLAACDKSGSASAPAEGSAAAAPAKDKGKGFSAELAADLGGPAAGSGKAGSAAGSAAGDAKAGDAKAGSAAGDAKAGSAAVASTAKVGSASPASGSAAASTSTSTTPAATEDDGDEPETTEVKPKSGKLGVSVVITPGAPVAKSPVPVSQELKAIKMTLLPNWERDVEGEGTLSFAVKLPGRNESALFVFKYGYEDSAAPSDRDAYKKWLAETKTLSVLADRQRGAAWMLEGTDGSGRPAFRFLVNFGGKKLICYGSLYKDSASNQLGDLRDQTIIQAKQICETLAL